MASKNSEFLEDLDLVEKSGKKVNEPKAGYVTIHVDEERGQPNYIPVGVNGTVYKIQRGVDVAVPPSVVEVLQNAIAHRTIQTTNPVTGLIETTEQAYNRIPWRIVYIPR